MARCYQESCFKLVLQCLLPGSRSLCTDEQLSSHIGFLKMGGLCNFCFELRSVALILSSTVVVILSDCYDLWRWAALGI